MHTTSEEKSVTTLKQRAEAIVGKDWTNKAEELLDKTHRLIQQASTELTTTFDNVSKETYKAGGKLFDTSLARDVTQSKDIAEIYKEYIEQIQKLQESMPQTTEGNEVDEDAQLQNAPKHSSEKDFRNALRQDLMKKIPEIFLSPLNVAANIVSAILRCLIAIVETAVLGILTLRAHCLPAEQKKVALTQIDAYKDFVKVSVIDAKSYSHAILAYIAKIKENLPEITLPNMAHFATKNTKPIEVLEDTQNPLHPTSN